METLLSSTRLSATAGKKRRRRKARKLSGGGAVASDDVSSGPLVSDLQLEEPNQMGIGGSEVANPDPSVYLVVSRGRWFSTRGYYYPLHKVEIASSSSREAPAPSRVTNMKADAGFKTFVSVQSRWIVGAGGDPGATVIFDTNTSKAIPGPKLLAAKLCPVVVAVGYRVYALSESARFITEGPAPAFEALDLSKTMDEAGNLSLLDRCSWEAMPPPPFFPRELPMAKEGMTPHIIAIAAYVAVGRYVLLSVYGPRASNFKFSFTSDEYHKVTYAFDTRLERWHKVDGDACLPFLGSATQLGRSGRAFLGLSRRNGPVNVYRICVSISTPSGSHAMAGVPDEDGVLKLSVTVFPLKAKADEEIIARTGHYFASLDGTCLNTLLHSLESSNSDRKYCKKTGQFYWRMLDAKLRTYQIESESLALLEAPDEEKPQAAKPKIVISSQREQAFRIFSAHGFYSPPIAFVVSI